MLTASPGTGFGKNRGWRRCPLHTHSTERQSAPSIDYEYERHGTGNLFMMCEPLVGQREVLVGSVSMTHAGGRRCCVPRSKAYARRMSVGSLQARPRKVKPIGAPSAV